MKKRDILNYYVDLTEAEARWYIQDCRKQITALENSIALAEAGQAIRKQLKFNARVWEDICYSAKELKLWANKAQAEGRKKQAEHYKLVLQCRSKVHKVIDAMLGRQKRTSSGRKAKKN